MQMNRSLLWGVADHQDGPGNRFSDRYRGLAEDVAHASAMGVWQYFRQHRKFIGRKVEVEDEFGRVWRGVNGASQDYLGLSSNPAVAEAAKAAIDLYGVHSSGSAPMGGGIYLSRAVESKISRATGMEHVCLFPTGWAAGYGIIYGLVRKRDHVVIDALAHNCLQHGAAAATNNIYPFIHNDMSSLRKRLERIRKTKDDGAILIVTEGLFSMDSDSPDFRTLIDLKKEFDAHILLDIAHDFGCLGPRGKGLLVETASYADIDYVIGSFSKTFASIGGFLATNCLPAKRGVQGYSGSYTFSNFPIPSQLGAVNAAMDIVFSDVGEGLRKKLLSNTLQLRESLAEKGIATIGRPSAMTIVSVGSEAEARLGYKALLEKGVILNCIEFPAVRKGEARFRIQLTPHHSADEIAMIANGLDSALNPAQRAVDFAV
jgi:glycine C-acetyltransferase